MALTEAQINTKLTAIDAAIDALVTNPQVDYKNGDKTVSAGQKMKQLIELREMYEKLLLKVPKEEIKDQEDSITSFGEDEKGELYLLSKTNLGPSGTSGDVRRIIVP